ncbi:MAG: saccharopine dehydrogenase C-terminal domain-containing protein [Ferruginibacter sp.]
MHIGILGAGMVGRAMALDLAVTHQVTSFDISDESLEILKSRNSAVQTVKADLADFRNYPALLAPFDYIISAVPGFMGFAALEAIIRCGKNVVDISFFPEDALQLDGLAKEKNVTAIMDCGVAPGMSNLVLGYYNAVMKVTWFECLVGGLPKKRVKPFEYKAPFSPVDVLEEYTRPARYQENGHVVVKPALSDPELINFEQVGTLESFNTDGLRSLLFTMSHIPDMKEKTLRYPGHIGLIQSLRQAGFLNPEPVMVKGQWVSPLHFTASLLFDQWKLGATEEEFTIMRISLGNETRTIRYDLFDVYDPQTGISSMSRTTGYTCTAALNMLAQGLFTQKGVFPPERVGCEEACFRFILNYLAERNVHYRVTDTPNN